LEIVKRNIQTKVADVYFLVVSLLFWSSTIFLSWSFDHPFVFICYYINCL